jgi:hypothetical protein
MRMFTTALLMASLHAPQASADTCGELANKFADEDARDGMTIGEMDDLRLCVGEWMRDQILQRNKGAKQSSSNPGNVPANQTAQAETL